MPDREAIRKWVQESINKGYSEAQVRQSMYKYGYDPSILDDVVVAQPTQAKEERQDYHETQESRRENTAAQNKELEERNKIYEQNQKSSAQSGFKLNFDFKSWNWLRIAKNYSLPVVGLALSGFGTLQLGSTSSILPSSMLAVAGAISALFAVGALYYRKIAYVGILFSLIGFLPILAATLQSRTSAFGGASVLSSGDMTIAAAGPLLLLIANVIALKR